MDAPFVTVLGHANIDVQIDLKGLPTAGASEPVQARRTVWGGTACNIARHAATLGVPTRLWARVGDDFPLEWRTVLEADGVDLSALAVEPGGRTPTCFILTDAAGEQAYCMDQGAMGNMVAQPPTAAVLDGMPAGAWLHLGTGQPEAYEALAAEARRRGMNVALDPGQELRFAYSPESFRRLLAAADLLFVNAFELGLALEYLGLSEPEELLDHVPTVVATDGGQGARLLRRDQATLHVPAPEVKVVDPTGAGDALRAGWYAALHAGADAEEALRWGVAAGAVAVGFEGPQGDAVRRGDLEALGAVAAFQN